MKEIWESYAFKADLHLTAHKLDTGVMAFYSFYSEDRIKSKSAKRYVSKLLYEYEEKVIDDFKLKKGIKHSDLNPYLLEDVDLSSFGNSIMSAAGVGIGGVMVFLLVIAIFNPVINTTIGERDQNTFKVLLMNPIGLHEIFIGKYLNVAFQGLFTLVPYAIETYIFYAWGKSTILFAAIPQLSPATLIFLFSAAISTSLLVTSICFLFCSFAKKRTQAQSLMSLMIMAIMIPIGMIGPLDVKLSKLSCLIPLINLPMITENLIMESPSYHLIATGLIINIAASLLLIWISLGAFLVQWKGSTEHKGISDLLNFERRKAKHISSAHAFIAFAICVLGYSYGGMLFSSFEINIFSFLFGPLFFCLGTSFFLVYYSGLEITSAFKWETLEGGKTLKAIIAAILLSIACTSIIQASGLENFFKVEFPPIFDNGSTTSLFAAILLFAVVPGIAEEFLFRGIIFQGLRKQYNYPLSVIVSSLFFGLAHFSMFKMGHTFVMGIALAYIYEKRGLITCMIVHMAFNSTSIAMSLIPPINGTTLKVALALFCVALSANLLRNKDVMDDDVPEMDQAA